MGSNSRVRQAVVLHQALDVTVEGQVVATELALLAVLAGGDHVEGRRALALLADAHRFEAVHDGGLELGHDGIVSPPRHGLSSPAPWRSPSGTARWTWWPGSCR